MQDYVNDLWKRQAVQKIIKENKYVIPGRSEKYKWRMNPPQVRLCATGTYSSAYYRNITHMIEVEVWYYSGGAEVKSTLRHEMAHALLEGCLRYISQKTPSVKKDPHRKEYKELLKKLFPRTWQSDMYWKETSRNMKERQKWIDKMIHLDNIECDEDLGGKKL